MPVELTVVGSINLDLVARVERLPRPGETVGGGALARYPGGKGANQAVAAARLGARVRMVGAVGEDAFAAEALAGLEAEDVELELERVGETGVALIFVDDAGETEIVTVRGANEHVTPRAVEGAVLCQLEVPDAVVLAAAEHASFVVLNAAPARPIALEPDLLVVNRLEHEVVRAGQARRGHVRRRGGRALRGRPRGGARGAAARHRRRRHRGRRRVHRVPARSPCSRAGRARRRSPALARPGRSPRRGAGAQPSLPTAAEVDAILAR